MTWFRGLRRRTTHDKQDDPSQSDGGPAHATSKTHRGQAHIRTDNPIRQPQEDTLGRRKMAETFAQQVLVLDVSEGVVVGVLGPWGSGKTSFVNLARTEFNRAGTPILDFNPWMFSGAQQLVDSFFVEVAAQLKIRPGLADVGKSLEDYGQTFSGISWLPFVGPWIERGRHATTLIGKILQRRQEGIGGRRRKVERALADLDEPIVIVLDDIDRLSTPEVRDIFKLVRSTASFPNIIYILAFDRARVEEALAEQGIPGRDYLVKIIQVAVDLPVVRPQVLSQQILGAIDQALAGISAPGPFDEHAWPDIFAETIRPLVRTMRDVRRYALAIRGTIVELGGQVAVADALAMEAIRVFLPDVFVRLHEAIDGLTKPSDQLYGLREDPPGLKEQIDGLIEAAKERGELVRSMIRRLFPVGTRHLPHGSHYGSDWSAGWLRDRRVAHPDILRLYLERVAGESLEAFIQGERAWTLLADRDALDAFLRSIDPDQLQDVIGSLEVYEEQFTRQQVVPATIVLLNLLPDLPERPTGKFTFGTEMVVTRVTYRLVRVLKDPAAIESAVREVLPQLTTLSSKLSLIYQVGRRENVGHELVSDVAAREFELSWRDEVRGASVDQLLHETDLIRVLFLAKRDAEASESALTVPDAPAFTMAMLRAARTEAQTQAFGSRAVRRFPRLNWEALVEIYGDEATLRIRIEAVKEANVEGAGDLLRLADKYVRGWRPGNFPEE